MRGRIAIVTDVGSGMRWTRRVAVCVIMHGRTACRGRSSRMVPIPRRWYHALMRKHHAQWWPTSPAHQEEYEAAVKTIAQGGPGCLGRPVVPAACIFCCRRAMGAASSRPSLRPCDCRGRERPAFLGHVMPREGGTMSSHRHLPVIASDSEAIQTCAAATVWIASSPALLGRKSLRGPQ
jgi:hypothetical protein